MRLGLREKIIGSMVLISVTVSVILASVFYTNSRTVIEDNYKETIEGNLRVCAGILDDVMKEAYYTAVNASGDTALKEYLLAQMNDDSEGAEALSVNDESVYAGILELLNSYRIGHVDSVYCYIPEQSILAKATSLETAIQECGEKEKKWLQEVLEKNENPFTPRFTVDTTELLRKEVFTYAKPIKDKNSRVIAWILANVDERNVFFFCLQGYGMVSDGSSCILDPAKRVVSGTNLMQLGRTLQEPTDNSSSISVSVEAPLTKYVILSRADHNVILGNIRKAGTWIFALTFLFNILALLPILTLVRKMLLPIQNLEEVMKQAGEGDLTVQAEIFADDEIGHLSEGFNDMIRQVENLIDALMKEQNLKKEAEIEALKYQITPHFMYNTLNSIRYAALMKGEAEIAGLLEAFIRLLQMSASDRGAFITVERELQMVDNYVRLQKFRYSDSFDVTFHIPENAKNYYVPGLMVQPLVENAILHGIDLKKGGDRISVSVEIKKEFLIIRVSDTGRGMTEDEVNRLMSGEQRSKFSGIGIRNVKERLELYYKGKGSLHFRSEKNHGTEAILSIPVTENAEEYCL